MWLLVTGDMPSAEQVIDAGGVAAIHLKLNKNYTRVNSNIKLSLDDFCGLIGNLF